VKRTVAEIMTRDVIVAHPRMPFKEIVRRMREARVSALPVLDDDGHLVGIVSEGDLILKEDPELDEAGRLFEGRHRRTDRQKAAGLFARELMSAPVVTVAPTASLGEAARLMHRRQVKQLPVVDETGRLVGILSRSDLLTVFLREDAEIEREVREDVIRRTLWIDPSTVRVSVRDGVVRLEGQLERRSLIPVLERLVASVDGVVGVEHALTYEVDDTVSTAEIPLPWTAVGPR
jgi:CBS domain-containing protein